MKKTLAFILALTLALILVNCAGSGADTKSEGVMTHAQYVAAPLDSQVVVETYVQAKQSWWENKVTVYT